MQNATAGALLTEIPPSHGNANAGLRFVQRPECRLKPQSRVARGVTPALCGAMRFALYWYGLGCCSTEARGNAAGNSRLRFESALGSLYEAQAGIRVAVAWGYLGLREHTAVALASIHELGGRLFGLSRR